MFGINWASVFDMLDNFGKHHWGFILVMFAISYFLSNFVRNVRAARRHAIDRAERRLDAQRFGHALTRVRANLNGTGFGIRRRNMIHRGSARYFNNAGSWAD